jgi:hypothetical protein
MNVAHRRQGLPWRSWWASLISGGALELNYWPRGSARRATTPISEKGLQAIMKRATFALLALVCLAGSSGCCCMDRLFCWGCRGPCAYGNEGPCYGGDCGGGGCSDCGGYSGKSGGSAGGYAEERGGPMPAEAVAARRRPAQGHPHAYQRRNSGGEYEFAAGPPTGATSYPYYTTRGPRDFLARNPRSIGP